MSLVWLLMRSSCSAPGIMLLLHSATSAACLHAHAPLGEVLELFALWRGELIQHRAQLHVQLAAELAQLLLRP